MEAAARAEAADELVAIDPRFRGLVTDGCVDRDASVTDTIKVSNPTPTHPSNCVEMIRKRSRMRQSTMTQATSLPTSAIRSER